MTEPRPTWGVHGTMEDVVDNRCEYHVIEFWAGWMGGWGADRNIETRINALSHQGWRLASTKSAVCLWMLVFPRHKLLLIFERPI